jgi:hypothetical protein
MNNMQIRAYPLLVLILLVIIALCALSINLQ